MGSNREPTLLEKEMQLVGCEAVRLKEGLGG